MAGARQRLWGLAASALVATLVLGACSGKSTDRAAGTAPGAGGGSASSVPSAAGGSSDSSAQSTPAAPPATISVTPASGAQAVSPVAPISASVADGTLTSVSLVNGEGKQVKGALSPDRLSWKVGEALGYGKTYTLTAIAQNAQGQSTTHTSSFTTVEPGNMTMPYLQTTGGGAIKNGATYGVGFVVNVHFDEAISDKRAAMKALSVKTNPPVAGAWYWLDDTNVHWRPQNYYKPGTTVTVSANVYGKQVSPGLYGQSDVSASFRIGAKHVSIADDNTHMVNVYFNDKLVNTMPTSMGRGGTTTGANGQTISFWTQRGTYTVLDKSNPVLMDSSTYGLPVNSKLGYKEFIYYATRISTDGVYLHQLDSTVWAQGNTDTSHGCLNLNYKNAKWFYENSQIGDVVTVKNTGGSPLEVWQNGDWSVPWSTWVKGGNI